MFCEAKTLSIYKLPYFVEPKVYIKIYMYKSKSIQSMKVCIKKEENEDSLTFKTHTMKKTVK